MHEHEHAELADLLPERLEARIVDPLAVEFGGDGDALETEFVPAAIELLERRSAAERVRMRRADEASGIVAFGLFGLVVDQPRGVEVGAHAGGTGQPRGIDAGDVHHPDMLVEIVE